MLNLVAAIIDIHGARSALWYNVTTFLNPEVLGTTLQVLFVICTPSLAVWLLLQRAYLKSRSDILLSIKMVYRSVSLILCTYLTLPIATRISSLGLPPL